MYAVVNFGGRQVKVIPGEKIFVDAQHKEAGAVFEKNEVMLIADGDTVIVGKPYVTNAAVKFEVLDNLKGKKVMVFKKKRRKGYRRHKSHRALVTALKVLEIVK